MAALCLQAALVPCPPAGVRGVLGRGLHRGQLASERPHSVLWVSRLHPRLALRSCRKVWVMGRGGTFSI